METSVAEHLCPTVPSKGFGFRLPLIALVLFSVILPRSLSAVEKQSPVNEGWQDATRLMFNEGYQLFSKIKPSATDQRTINFGRAATLINVQPKTDGNIRDADELLQDIIKTNPDDEIGIASQYLSGRIAQIHMTPPDEDLAIRRYTALIESHPQHPLGQAAMTKRALIRVFYLSEEPSLETRYQLAVKESAAVTDPGARRDYLIILANTSILLKKPANVTMEHLLQAELCNNFRRRALADLYIRIAEFAAAAGKKDVAAAYYKKFLDGFLRDNRRFLIEEKLASLTSKGAAK